MTGKRKLTAFFITTGLIFLVHLIGFFVAVKSGQALDISSIVSTYSLVQGTLTGAFFGFNFGEHWSKARGGR